PKGSAELMWEAFHAFVEKGRQPVSGAAEARDQVVLLREVLSDIGVADRRSLEAEETATATDADGPAEPAAADEAAPDGPAGGRVGGALWAPRPRAPRAAPRPAARRSSSPCGTRAPWRRPPRAVPMTRSPMPGGRASHRPPTPRRRRRPQRGRRRGSVRAPD